MEFTVNWDIVTGVLIVVFIDIVRWFAVDRGRLKLEIGKYGKEYQENLRRMRESDAKGYFRDNYRLFAGFLSVHHQVQQALSEETGQEEAQLRAETRERLRSLLPRFFEAYGGLRDSGYMALLPGELSRQVYRYAGYLNVVNALLKKEEDTDIMGDEKLRAMWMEVPVIGRYITEGFRYLLGVDGLEVAPLPPPKEPPKAAAATQN